MQFWDSLYSKYFKIWDHPSVNNIEVHRKEVVPEIAEPVKEIASEPVVVVEDQDATPEPIQEVQQPEEVTPEPVKVVEEPEEIIPEPVKVVEQAENIVEVEETVVVENNVVDSPNDVIESQPEIIHVNGNGIEKKPRPSNEIKMVQHSNGGPRDVIRANDPPEDDLPKNIGVNKFVNFFESLGGKK